MTKRIKLNQVQNAERQITAAFRALNNSSNYTIEEFPMDRRPI